LETKRSTPVSEGSPTGAIAAGRNYVWKFDK